MPVNRLIAPLLALAVVACSGQAPPQAAPTPAPSPSAERGVGGEEGARPVPYPVVPPAEFLAAVAEETRTLRGVPGEDYWQQWVEYDIDARVDVEAKTLTGSETIRYHNRSPRQLPVLVINLLQNYHAEGVERVRPTEVTGGMTIDRVAVNGRELGPTGSPRTPGWLVEGTLMMVVPPSPVDANGSVELAIDWSFPIPRQGASARMGHTDDELLYLAYWYPQVAAFDDVIGWHAEAFRGNAEFYSDFGDYDLTLDVPEGWLVMSTGSLDNPEEVLVPEVVERLRAAEQSDDVVHVVAHGAADRATAGSEDGRLRWRFSADSVRDAAFAVMRNHAWDAARTPVGDRDGDGVTEYARVDAFWRESARNYDEAWRYAQHSIDFLSRFTGLPYPWPHMTLIEGGGIIGGGMEFPQMTLLGDYNRAGAEALYGVTAHELAHMWIPMMLSTNERRYAWLDEGTTSFNENNARAEFYDSGNRPFLGDQMGYLNVARAGMEGPIMRWSDFHRPGAAYGTASYAKPSAVLHALRGVLGEDLFEEAYRAFYDRWAFRLAYPWDFFNTFEDVSGRELDWFWRAWYYESSQDGEWVLDQAVAAVERLESGETRITIRDEGWVPMPVHLTITRADGEVVERTIPVDRWLTGRDTATLTLPAGPPVEEVVIDAARYFPDIDRRNNVWGA